MNLVMYKKNDFAEAIYFVAYGRAGYKIDKKQFIFKEVIQGGWFGEVELIHNCLRRFTVVTRAPWCKFLVMSKALFEEVREDYPSTAASFNRIAVVKEQKDLEAMKQAVRLLDCLYYRQDYDVAGIRGQRLIAGSTLPPRPRRNYAKELSQLERMYRLKEQFLEILVGIDTVMKAPVVKRGSLQTFPQILEGIKKSARLIQSIQE